MDFERVIRCRRSIRKYGDRQITETEVQKLLEAAMAAPVSNKRYEDIYITAIQKKDILDQIEKFANMEHIFYGARTIIVISSKEQSVEHIKEFNVACMIENMLLEATNLGLGSVYLSYFLTQIEHKEDLSKLLGIPKEYEPLSAIAVGNITKEDAWAERSDIKDRIQVNYI